MANTTTPYGLRCVGATSGEFPQQVPLLIPSGYGTSIFVGDAVAVDASGYIVPATAGTGNTILGVFTGMFIQDPASGSYIFKGYFPAGTTTVGGEPMVAQVIIDPNALFTIKSATALTLAATFATANLTTATPGSTTTGFSGMAMNGSALGTAGQLAILGLNPDPLNSYGANNDMLVIINDHNLRQIDKWA